MTATAPAWLLADAAPVEAAATHCREAADATSAAAAALTRSLGGAALAAGWDGRAAGAAAGRASAGEQALTRLARALTEAADELAELARVLRGAGAEAHRLAAEARELQARTAVERWDPVARVADAFGDGYTERVRRLAQVEAALEEAAAIGRRADVRAAEALEGAARAIEALVDPFASHAGWVGTAVPAGARPALQALGLLALEDDSRLVQWARTLPPGPEGDRLLRRRLGELSPTEVATLLEAHPELAARLDGLSVPAGAPAGSAEALLAAALATAPGAARLRAVRTLFAGLVPAEGRMLALLYPGVVGALDGAPAEHRYAANRLLVTVALHRRRTELAGLLAAHERAHESWQPWDDNDLDGDLAAVVARVQLYERLLTEPVPNLGRVPGEPTYLVGHQVLLFDDAGDGRLAEVWGNLSRAANIGVLVPGTGTDITNVADFSAHRTASFARKQLDGSLAMVTWMGADLPDSVPLDAPFSDYSESAAPLLRNFVAGLDRPADAAVTVAGHSYGGAVVGVAEREGLVADRILHVESAGAGAGVDDVDDYPVMRDGDPGNDPDRYSMTAPDDFIGVVQGAGDVGGMGHGADPDTLTGVTRLETGFRVHGDPSSGRIDGVFASHSDVFVEGSTAWDNMYQVFTGGRVHLAADIEPRIVPTVGGPAVVWYDPLDEPGYEMPTRDIE